MALSFHWSLRFWAPWLCCESLAIFLLPRRGRLSHLPVRISPTPLLATSPSQEFDPASFDGLLLDPPSAYRPYLSAFISHKEDSSIWVVFPLLPFSFSQPRPSSPRTFLDSSPGKVVVQDVSLQRSSLSSIRLFSIRPSHFLKKNNFPPRLDIFRHFPLLQVALLPTLQELQT